MRGLLDANCVNQLRSYSLLSRIVETKEITNRKKLDKTSHHVIILVKPNTTELETS